MGGGEGLLKFLWLLMLHRKSEKNGYDFTSFRLSDFVSNGV